MAALMAARDISIIILALSSVAVMVLLAVLIFQTIRLTRMLREEILPMLQATQETLGTVRGTATFMGDHLVQPVVKASSYAHGVKSALRALFGGPSTDRRN
jgi:hypothetical protein